MKAGDIMEEVKDVYLELDDTLDIGKVTVVAKDENEQTFYNELTEKYKNKYHIG